MTAKKCKHEKRVLREYGTGINGSNMTMRNERDIGGGKIGVLYCTFANGRKVWVHEWPDGEDDFHVTGIGKDGKPLNVENAMGWQDAMALAAFGEC